MDSERALGLVIGSVLPLAVVTEGLLQVGC